MISRISKLPLLPVLFLFVAGILHLPATAQQTSPKWREASIKVGDLTRHFRVLAPPTLRPKAPVVIVLHGGTQSMRAIFRPNAGGSQAWASIAEKERFLLVAPNGTNPSTGNTNGDEQVWNDLRTQGLRNTKADDIGFLKALVTWIGANHDIDKTRIYITGASNGGMMTYRALMEMSNTFAAGAAFISSIPKDSPAVRKPDRPVPIMICNGTEDKLVPFQGSTGGGGRPAFLSAEKTRDWWIEANRAKKTSDRLNEKLLEINKTDGVTVYRSLYPADENGAPVLFLRCEGGGHCMPSIKHPLGAVGQRLMGAQSRDIEGAQMAWEFMRNHKLR